ncbi:hypothetical protein H8D85_02355 [bacterium]|nr:hypothetical protein [bacterium]
MTVKFCAACGDHLAKQEYKNTGTCTKKCQQYMIDTFCDKETKYNGPEITYSYYCNDCDDDWITDIKETMCTQCLGTNITDLEE